VLKSEATSSDRHCTPHCSEKTKLAKDREKGIFYIYKEKGEVGELRWQVRFFIESMRRSEYRGGLYPPPSSVVQ